MRKLLPLAATALLLFSLSACDPDTPKPSPSKKPTPISANFAVEAIGTTDARDRPEAAEAVKVEADKIKQLIDSFYNIAFVQPDKWAGGQHGELAGLFAPEAQGAVAANLGGLALTDIAPKIAKVTIKEQRISKLNALVEEDLTSSNAIVNISFAAVGQPKAKGAQPVDVVHTMTVWLRPEAGAWRIWSYSANLKADSRVKAAAWGPLAEEGA